MELNGKQSSSILAYALPVPVGHWTEPRNEIFSWLQEEAPSLAELYQSAVYLIFGEPMPFIPGRIRLVAHCCREICNQLLVVKIGKKNGGRLDYVKRLEEIAQTWEIPGFSMDGGISHQASLPTSSPDVNIPRELFSEIAALIKEHTETSSTLRERVTCFFKEQFPENQPYRDDLSPIVDQWMEVTNWFVGNAHDKGKVDADYNKQELLDKFALLELSLGTFARSFYSITDEIDELLEEANASTD